MGKFNNPPEGNADPKSREVIYIGETCKRTLKKRWNEFHKAAFKGGDRHSGGKNYREKINDNGSDLYIAFFVPNKEESINSAYIRFKEKKLIQILSFLGCEGG